MDDLSLVETKHLLDELDKRHEACIFIGLQKISSEIEDSSLMYGGSYATCLGLLEHFKNYMMVQRLTTDAMVMFLGDEEEEDGGEGGDPGGDAP